MDTPQSTARIAGHPLHPLLVTLPIGCWVLAFLADLVLWRGGELVWGDAATWLIGTGVVTALIAAIAGFIDFFGDRRIRDLARAWWHMLGNLAAVVVSLVNLLFHTRGAAGIVPNGLILSGVVVLILLFTGWQGGELVFRHGVGVHPRPEVPR